MGARERDGRTTAYRDEPVSFPRKLCARRRKRSCYSHHYPSVLALDGVLRLYWQDRLPLAWWARPHLETNARRYRVDVITPPYDSLHELTSDSFPRSRRSAAGAPWCARHVHVDACSVSSRRCCG